MCYLYLTLMWQGTVPCHELMFFVISIKNVTNRHLSQQTKELKGMATHLQEQEEFPQKAIKKGFPLRPQDQRKKAKLVELEYFGDII